MPIEANELLALTISVSVFVFVFTNFRLVRGIARSSLLLTSFYCFLIGKGLTILEGFYFQVALNILEHIFYTTSSVFILMWISRFIPQRTSV